MSLQIVGSVYLEMPATERCLNITFVLWTLRTIEVACGKAVMKKMRVCMQQSTLINDKNIERVRNVGRGDRRKSIQEISAEV
jgi:hypothetical protein